MKFQSINRNTDKAALEMRRGLRMSKWSEGLFSSRKSIQKKKYIYIPINHDKSYLVLNRLRNRSFFFFYGSNKRLGKRSGRSLERRVKWISAGTCIPYAI